MKHSTLGAALMKLRGSASNAPADPDASASLNGTSFLELEPDLRKEAGEYARRASAWAASGHPASE